MFCVAVEQDDTENVMRILNKTAYLTLLCLTAIACGKQNANERHPDDVIRVRIDTEDTKASVLTTDEFKKTPGKFIMEAYVDRDVFKDKEGQHAHTRVGNAYFGPTSKLEENVIYEGESWNLWYWDPANANKERCFWVSSDGNMSFWSWVKLKNSNFSIDKDKSALYLTSPNMVN